MFAKGLFTAFVLLLIDGVYTTGVHVCRRMYAIMHNPLVFKPSTIISMIIVHCTNASLRRAIPLTHVYPNYVGKKGISRGFLAIFCREHKYKRKITFAFLVAPYVSTMTETFTPLLDYLIYICMFTYICVCVLIIIVVFGFT